MMNWLRIWLPILLLCFAGTGYGDKTLLPFERVTVQISWDLEGWFIGHENVLTEFTLIEWVPNGQSIEEWNSQFKAIRYANTLMPADDARQLAQQFVDRLSHRCNNPEAIQHEILAADASSALISWSASACDSDVPYSFDQRELTRFIVGEEFTFNLAFTRKPEKDQKPKIASPLLTDQERLAILQSVEIKRLGEIQSADTIGPKLMTIPAYRTYALFSDPGEHSGRIWLEEVARMGTGRSTQVQYRLKGEALPPDHWYAVWMIRLPEGLPIPVQQGLKLGQNAELACPPYMDGMPAVQSVTGTDFTDGGFALAFPCSELPNRSINETMSIEISDFQAGLAIAVGVQSHDASHRYLTRAVPRPIQGQDANCRIELELVSPDGRTYLLRGSGYGPGEALGGSWRYAKNEQELDIRVLADGSFTYPLFHSGQAKGRKKWEAEIQLAGSSCASSIEYFWGKKGMSK
jgi:hypothetical protein